MHPACVPPRSRQFPGIVPLALLVGGLAAVASPSVGADVAAPAKQTVVTFLDAIKRLVLAKSYSRVRALISDPARAVRTGNKFVALAARLNTCIDIRNLQEHRVAQESIHHVGNVAMPNLRDSDDK